MPLIVAAAVFISSATVGAVKNFIDTPIAELSPEDVPLFMSVNPAGLPAPLRRRYLAKRQELLALQKIAEGKKKPPLRRAGMDEPAKCAPPVPGSDEKLGIFLLAHYEKITGDEAKYLMDRTNCSECELRMEFSLEILASLPKKKGKAPKYTYLMHGLEPIMTLVGEYRQGKSSKGTDFFGISAYPKCR